MDYTRQAKEVLKIAEKSAKEMAHPYDSEKYTPVLRRRFWVRTE